MLRLEGAALPAVAQTLCAAMSSAHKHTDTHIHAHIQSAT